MKLVTNKYTVSYEQLTAAATSMTHHWYCPYEAGYLVYLNAKVTTAFAGVTRPYVKLGCTNLTDGIIEDQPLDKAGSLNIGGKFGTGFCTSQERPKGVLQDQVLFLTFGSAATNLSSLTAGEIEFVTVYAVPA
jgi:hypothetical protein